jgi:5-formyltetrahydrofolate cyclo-ligase
MRRSDSEDSRQNLRQAALARRRLLAPGDAASWSGLIQARAVDLSAYRDSAAVALYSPVDHEVDTAAILGDALKSAKKIYYPKLSEAGKAYFARIGSASELVAGPYGILEPAGSEALVPADDGRLMVFIPGLLFDRQGNRLGRGGGWYDRALGNLPQRGIFVGLAYEFQLIETLAVQPWDQKVQLIITEKGRIECERPTRQWDGIAHR